MIDLPTLNAAQVKTLIQALSDPHSIRVDLAILTLDEDELSRLTPQILSGQVNVDADADVTRSMSVTLLDRNHALHLDSDSPADGALYADRMIQAIYSVLVPGISERVDIEIFTGPIVDLERDGDQINITAHGKEELGMGWIWQPITIAQGARKTDAIRTVMSARTGETNFDIPDIASRLPQALSLGRAAAAFPRMKKLGQSMDRQLYYNGAGALRLRIVPRRPVFTFKADHPTQSNITSRISVNHDFAEVKNAIWFKGGVPKGQKKPIEVFLAAPPEHPLSPLRLGRTDEDGRKVGRYLVEEHNNDAVRSLTEAKKRTESLLDDLLVEVLGVNFTSVPIAFLDPLDVVRVTSRDFSANVRLRQFALPLAGGHMTVGYIERVGRPNRRRIRRRGKRRVA